MKIVIIGHTYIAPINREKWKCFAQHYQHINLTVIIPKQWPSNFGLLETHNLESDNLSNCTFIALDTIKTGNEIRYRYKNKQLYKLLKECNPDLIHVEQGEQALSYLQAIACSKAAGLNTRFSFFTWVNWEPKTSLKYKIGWQWIERLNRYCSTSAITGNHDAQKILNKKGFTQPIAIIPQLGVNTEIFTPAVKTEHSARYVLGYFGRLMKEKGVMLLAESFNLLHKKFPFWNLTLMGDGPCKKELESFIKDNQLEQRILIKKPVAHLSVAKKMRLLDGFVLPSYDTPTWREQFGHVLIEAMASGVPIIASDGGEIPHVVSDAGIIFKQNDLQAMTHALEYFMSLKNKQRMKIAEKGLERVHKHYSHEAIAKKTHSFWKEILKGDSTL